MSKRRFRWDGYRGLWRTVDLHGKPGVYCVKRCGDCDREALIALHANRCTPCRHLRHEALKALRAPAHKEVARAIRHGELARPSIYACADCGQPAEVYDHRDYSRPLVVVAVCRGCNVRRGSIIPGAMRYRPHGVGSN